MTLLVARATGQKRNAICLFVGVFWVLGFFVLFCFCLVVFVCLFLFFGFFVVFLFCFVLFLVN